MNNITTSSTGLEMKQGQVKSQTMTFKEAVQRRYFKRNHSTKKPFSFSVLLTIAFLSTAGLITLTQDHAWSQVGRSIVNALIPMAAADEGDSGAGWPKLLPRRGRVLANGSSVAGVKVYGGWLMRPNAPVRTAGGEYNFDIYKRGCVGSSHIDFYDIEAIFTTKSFHPEAPEFSDVSWAWAGKSLECYGFEIYNDWAKVLVPGIGILSEERISEYGHAVTKRNEEDEVTDIFVDTMVFAGVGRLVNLDENDNVTLISAGEAEITEYEYSNPSSTGLLKTLSKEDLKKTDVYIFRVSNGMMVAKHIGLGGEYFLKTKNTDHFSYRFPIPGARHHGFLPHMREGWEDAQGIAESLRGYTGDHLRPGEAIKIIAINRPSGYIGVVNTTAALPENGVIEIPSDDIVLRPPNLKVWAERIYTVEKGLTDGEQREYTIGFEGSGLTTDTMVSIHTQWFDQDGSPLPEELEGYTGRMAKVSAPNTLAAEGGGTGTFAITPGNHQQVLKFKGDILGTEHFYIHVSGFSAWQSAGIGAASSGPLQYRPKNYVPIKVPVLNANATAQARNLNDKAAAVYDWPYRPEMQFSVFDLKINDITVINEDDDGTTTTQSIYLNEKPIIDTEASMVELFFDLLKGENAPLERFDGERELVFVLGEEEVSAKYGAAGQLEFKNLEDLSKLEPADYLSIQLYDKNDSENVLWEWAFGIEGIQLNTSADEGSDAVDSFIICYPGAAAKTCDSKAEANTITAELIGTFQPTDTITWKVEALKSDSASTQANGKTKTWKTGRLGAVTVATGINANQGKYSEAWQSQPITAQNAKFFSFMPDMSAVPHLPVAYTSGGDDAYSINGTKRTDVFQHNPHVAYKISAIITKGGVVVEPEPVIAKMDHTDALRQEYINHLASAADAAGKGVYVPTRDEFTAKSSLTGGDWVTSDYPYDVLFWGDLLAPLWNGVNDNFINYRTNPFIGFNNTSFTVPNNQIKVTSAYRNPERNERVGGKSGSYHMRARALDVGFKDLPYPTTDVPVDQRGLTFGPLYRMMRDTNPVPSASMYQLEGRAGPSSVQLRNTVSSGYPTEPDPFDDSDGDNIPNEYELSYHLHIQDAT